MNRKQALKILGFMPTTNPTEAEIKKAFKKKAVKLHPDVNKSENAEKQFKDLNAAQEVLNRPPEQEFDFPFVPSTVNGGFMNFVQDFAQGFGINFGPWTTSPKQRVSPHVQANIKLTFSEAVLGCDKKIKISRLDMCKPCSGQGRFKIDQKCKACNGTGGKVTKNKNAIFKTICGDCNGLGSSLTPCKPCEGSGTIKNNNVLSINIPGGINNGQTINLRGAGNFVPGMGNNRGSVFITANVDVDPDMTLNGRDVISTIELSLYEALKGTTKKVRTVKGKVDIKIKPKSRNKDKINLHKYGVEGKGKHIFILNVEYPEDITKIIDVLEEKVKE